MMPFATGQVRVTDGFFVPDRHKKVPVPQQGWTQGTIHDRISVSSTRHHHIFRPDISLINELSAWVAMWCMFKNKIYFFAM